MDEVGQDDEEFEHDEDDVEGDEELRFMGFNGIAPVEHHGQQQGGRAAG